MTEQPDDSHAREGAKLRIVHCFRSPVGGIFRHVRDLAEAQAAEGHSVGIVCDSSTGGAREEELIQALLPHLELGLHRTPMKRQVSPSDLLAFLRLFRRIKALNPDIRARSSAPNSARMSSSTSSICPGRPSVIIASIPLPMPHHRKSG